MRQSLLQSMRQSMENLWENQGRNLWENEGKNLWDPKKTQFSYYKSLIPKYNSLLVVGISQLGTYFFS